MKTLCKVPAKLIVSGEHAVVYGAPALSMAIDQYTLCSLQQKQQAIGERAFIEIELPDFQQKHALPFATWRDRALTIESKYQLYRENRFSIEAVLQQPLDLIISCLFHFDQRYKIKLNHWTLKLESEVLLGRGLGSSASVIISLLHSLYVHHGIAFTAEEIIDLAKTIESRQHGQSSGIDPATVFYGGLIEYQNGNLHQLKAADLHAWLVDSGKPEVSTGTVVNSVKQWAESELMRKDNSEAYVDEHPIWREFAKTTEGIKQAWLGENKLHLYQQIKLNQSLLEKIQATPPKMRPFLRQINLRQDCAIKVCGAGANEGDSAGIMLLISEQSPTELDIQYPVYPVQMSLQGSHCELVE